MTRFLLIFVLLCAPLHAATYYVTKAGHDTTGNGSVGTPWLTIGKAVSTATTGDTVLVGDGDYDEHVEESTAGVTFRAINQGQAAVRAWRLRAADITVDGFTIDRFSGVGVSWGAGVRIEAAADRAVVTNNAIKDLPHIIAHDLTFGVAHQSITSASSDFIAAGFKVGSKVYLGACGLDHATKGRQYYNDHDTYWTIETITQHTITLTSGSAAWIGDTGSNWWGFIRAGSGNSGYPAILAVEVDDVGPADVEITNNTITNWPSHAINITGNGHLVEGNKLTSLKSFRFLQFSGSDHIIRRNVIRNNPNVLHFSPQELRELIHPPGTGFYDYAVAMISAFVGDGNDSNVLIEENWFENNENQMGLIDDGAVGVTGITLNRNVFIGLSQQFNGGRDNMVWSDNTLYRCNWFETAHPLSIGGNLADANTGYELTGNLFVACGPHGLTETRTRGYYNLPSWLVDPLADENFVTSEEVTGYLSKTDFTEPNGVNGGDPIFYNALDPIGPDGEAFTADDGLKVLANSPAAALGGGALGVRPVTTGQPVAHFRITTPTGWFEETGTDYDPIWLAKLPTTRTGPQRPYTTPVSIGEAPVTATFNAEKSISGVAGASTNTAISTYRWDFGDGSAVVSGSSATATHTFSDFGDFSVVLTVTNTAGNSHTTSQIYHVRGVETAPGVVINVPDDYLTIDEALFHATPGDTILVGAGVYPETADTVRSGTADQRITIDGQGVATMKQFQFENQYITLKNMRFESAAIPAFGNYIYLDRGAHYARIENCTIVGQYTKDVNGIVWAPPSTKPFGTDAASNCVITGVDISNLLAATMISFMGDNNVIEHCNLHDGRTIDFLRGWGRNNIVRDNVCRNNIYFSGVGNHADFIQTFGNNGFGSDNIIIERNFVDYIENGGLTQLEGNLVEEAGNWIFRNNIFSRVGNTASCTIPGVKYYNNTFYRCNWWNKGHALSYGGRLYGKTSTDSSQSEYPELAIDVPSGSLVPGTWYVVVTSDKGVTMDPGATITYNGRELKSGAKDEFLCIEGLLTYTETDPDTFVGKALPNFSHDIEVRNNTFIECGDGTNTKGWYSVGTTYGPLTGTLFSNNHVSGLGFAAKRAGTAAYPDPAYNAARWYEPTGINGGDPGLTDISNFDFRPQTGSILIDAGVDLDDVPSDFLGTVRPLVVRTDIGAYEYDDGNPPPDPPDPPAPQVPAAPINLVQSGATQTSITIGWTDQSNNETGFKVYWSRDDAVYSLLTTAAANATTATHSGLSPSVGRYYRVLATNSVGDSAFVQAGPFLTLATINPPTEPTNLVATVQGANTVRLTWIDTATNESGFELERSGDATAWVPMLSAAANATAAQVTGLEPSTTYYFRIRAVGTTGFSAWVQTLAVTTDPLPSVIRGGRAPRANQAAVIPP